MSRPARSGPGGSGASTAHTAHPGGHRGLLRQRDWERLCSPTTNAGHDRAEEVEHSGRRHYQGFPSGDTREVIPSRLRGPLKRHEMSAIASDVGFAVSIEFGWSIMLPPTERLPAGIPGHLSRRERPQAPENRQPGLDHHGRERRAAARALADDRRSPARQPLRASATRSRYQNGRRSTDWRPAVAAPNRAGLPASDGEPAYVGTPPSLFPARSSPVLRVATAPAEVSRRHATDHSVLARVGCRMSRRTRAVPRPSTRPPPGPRSRASPEGVVPLARNRRPPGTLS